MWARGLRLAQSPNGIDEAALPTPERPQRPAPTTLPSWRLESALGSAMGWRSFGEAYEFRLVAGAPFTELGPATVWGRLKLPLLAGSSEEHTSELQSLMRTPYAVACLKKKHQLSTHT